MDPSPIGHVRRVKQWDTCGSRRGQARISCFVIARSDNPPAYIATERPGAEVLRVLQNVEIVEESCLLAPTSLTRH
jgi:hypothetical protein